MTPCSSLLVYDPSISANDLNHDLNIILQMGISVENGVSILILLSKQLRLYFSCKKSTANHPQLIFNGSVVAKVINEKHLGLILDEKIMKAKKNVGVLKYLFNFLPLKIA